MVRKLDSFVNEIIEGDAIDVMKQIPDDSIDMTFADPPFNIGLKFFI